MLASKSERTPSTSAWLSQASVQIISRASPAKFAVAGCAKLKIGANITRQTARYPRPIATGRSDRRRGDSAAMRLSRRRRVEQELVGANPPRRRRRMKIDRVERIPEDQIDPPFDADD